MIILNFIDFIAKWTLIVALVLAFVAMAGYIGMDLFVEYMNENYIVIPKNY